MYPLCKILNTPVMSICLVKQNDGTWVEKHQRFFIQRLQTFFFIFVTFLRFLTFFIFFWNVFYIYGFYRATSCVTAVFAVGRCPSVRPSVRHVHVLYCIQTAEDIIKHLSRPGSSMILVIDPKRWYSYFQEDLFIGGAKYTGPFAILDWNRRLSRKR